MIIRGRQRRGYTILEVMIFIAISSFIFIAAIGTIGGRQQQVQFAQSVREFESKITDVINDVTTGYYPTNSSINCSVNGSDRPVIGGSSDDESVGTNNECLYVGKALQFVPSQGGAGKFVIYNLAGRRYSTGIVTVKDIDDAKPVAVASKDSSFADAVEVFELRFGVKVTKVFKAEDSGQKYGIVGLLANFEGTSPADVSVSSSQSVQVGGIKTSGDIFGLTKSTAINLINKLTENSSANNGYIDVNSQGIVICLEDEDSKKRVASVTIGGEGGSTTQLAIDDRHEGCKP